MPWNQAFPCHDSCHAIATFMPFSSGVQRQCRNPLLALESGVQRHRYPLFLAGLAPLPCFVASLPLFWRAGPRRRFFLSPVQLSPAPLFPLFLSFDVQLAPHLFAMLLDPR